ncbi:ABC transporter ATP-binding protein [Halorubellus salinus]|uniref:ABC transporter ATP-binding protein n=1 Tax=Halorubellus salinus TaxID=755309 RepID=UPI001D0717FE|nr:ABC transporter ATP-binding protein [Halorubellus salinus]
MTAASGAASATDDDAATILDIQGLTKRFGGLTAVDDLSFSVRDNEILGFIGPNGAGKSTVFNCVTGVHKPTSGTITFDGEDITGKRPYQVVKRGLARTFQNFRPLGDRPVIENVELALMDDSVLTLEGLRGRTTAEAARICERVGLGEDLHRLPDELPHAGLLRLELGRALASNPRLLLIDEPFAGLSNREVETVSELLTELRAEGMTLVVVDHNMRGLFSLIDRAVVINFGALVAEGTPAAVKQNPEVQEAYLGRDSS